MSRGGKREGSGRKSTSERHKSVCVTLKDSELEILKVINKNRSRAIRELINKHSDILTRERL